MIGNPLLTINFDVPGYLIYHPFYRLSHRNVSITLTDFYYLDQNMVNDMENMKYLYEVLLEIIEPLAFIHGCLNFGFISIHGITSLNIIKCLRYMKINYPPQASFVFIDSKIIKFNFFEFSIDLIDENLPLIYRKYEVKKNFLEMEINNILILIGLIFVAGFFKIIKAFLHLKNSTFHNMITQIEILFCMNLFFLFYLSKIMEITFFCFVNFQYYKGESSFEVFSLISSIFMACFSVILHIIMYKMILKKTKICKIVPCDLNSNSVINLSRNEQADPNRTKNKIKSGFHTEMRRNTWWTAQEFGVSKTKLENSVAFSTSRINLKLQEKENDSKKIEFEETISGSKNSNEKISSILILIKDFLQDSTTQYLYVLFLKMRYMILALILVLLFPHTYILIISYFVINGLYLMYIFMMQPFSTIFLFIVNLIVEIFIMMTITGTLFLYLSQSQETLDYDRVMFFGWVIYYGSIFLTFTLILTYVWEIIVSLLKKIEIFQCF